MTTTCSQNIIPQQQPGQSAEAGHGHPEHLAHHFDTPAQQYESAKLGTWLFLCTEILMFGGLFCAYAIYRHNHPDVFRFAHHALSSALGGINTVVLISSSLTMAWAVRCAQLNQRKGLMVCLVLSLLGGFGFMGIKTIEYRAKWQHHIWVGQSNMYHPDSPYKAEIDGHHEGGHWVGASAGVEPAQGQANPPAAAAGDVVQTAPLFSEGVDHTRLTPPAVGVSGVTPSVIASGASPQRLLNAPPVHAALQADQLSKPDRDRIHIFFQIYFMMTGLHGFHVVVGMGLITWLIIKASKGHFSSEYFTPVDLVGLYWHLVDLIWIFLFPLLYLIH